MSYLAIVIIILLGIFLLLLEFLVIPGITVFGIGGFLFILTGIGSAYYFHGPAAGHYTLAATVVFSVMSLYFTFKQKTWKKLGLKASIDSKVETFDTRMIQVGDKGKTVTRLAPMGKVEINRIICEAKSTGQFIHENTEVEVLEVLSTQIIVKPLN